jgi:hypothetical protein
MQKLKEFQAEMYEYLAQTKEQKRIGFHLGFLE